LRQILVRHHRAKTNSITLINLEILQLKIPFYVHQINSGRLIWKLESRQGIANKVNGSVGAIACVALIIQRKDVGRVISDRSVCDARRESVGNADCCAVGVEFGPVQTIVIHQNSVFHLIVRVPGEEVVKTVCKENS